MEQPTQHGIDENFSFDRRTTGDRHRPEVRHVCPCGTEFYATKRAVYCSRLCKDRFWHRNKRASVPHVVKKPRVRRAKREPVPIPKATLEQQAEWNTRLSKKRLSMRRGEHSKRLRYTDPGSFAFHRNTGAISAGFVMSPLDKVSVAWLRTEQRQRTFQNRPRTARICEHCGAGFIAHRRTAKFCSAKCKLRNHRQKHGQTKSLLQ